MLKWILCPVAAAALVASSAKVRVVIGPLLSLRAAAIMTISKTILRAALASNLKWNTPKRSSRTNVTLNPTLNVNRIVQRAV